MNIEAVRREALKQLEAERFENAVRMEVQRLKERRPWWHALFPFEVTIRRRK